MCCRTPSIAAAAERLPEPDPKAEKRAETGVSRFRKGRSGNPRGRLKTSQAGRDFRKYVREHGAEIAERLMEIVRAKRSPLASVQAARVMLQHDRAPQGDS